MHNIKKLFSKIGRFVASEKEFEVSNLKESNNYGKPGGVGSVSVAIIAGEVGPNREPPKGRVKCTYRASNLA